ncbi:sulfur oxidation c-type cytochrome SoxA [Pseudaquabacterium pictum]|uniref:SoxAX cytochrome complex subunit A n=1 Tax=Pseudaquabacterium pictum TaxID=2315236 RepID=A0A480AQ58_9BURK|nr:sulfur oxidation c-type cytochrome SoxA [Rubrivivax pictus]GCL63553.1 SoxAX cytochrome complex subunit A [Rubrivivax pictus]
MNRRSAALLALAMLALPATADDGRRSGLTFMGPALQALQRDDGQNPAMLWVQDGEQLWRSPAGTSGKRCADCHGDASRSMAGVAARYPAWDAASGGALNLAGRINACRSRHQQAAALPVEHADLLALSAYVGLQSRGQPLAPPDDARLAPLRQQGQLLWQQRLGQLNLACLHCHDQRAGQRLGGAVIPQGHATGYPSYRLEWQALGSLQRRLRGCVVGVRAEPWAADAPAWLALEAHLAQRAAGMPVETPAVRP